MNLRVVATTLYLFISTVLSSTLFAQTHTIANVLRFADPLSDNMVVQQNKPFKVWGTAPENEDVRIEASWLESPVTVRADAKGNFAGIIAVPGISPGDFTAHVLSIHAGANEHAVLTNILIGEVWFFGGQSNMQSPVIESTNGAAEVANANFENIRLFNAALNFSNTPLSHIKGSWVKCTPKTVERFSAVAYFFARYMHTLMNVPVGVIFSGIGASTAQAWVAKEVLAADKKLDSLYLNPYITSERSKEAIDGGFTFEKVTRPFLLYNAMIHPFVNLSIKGFCWYQGESNRSERAGYTHLMYALIKSWRSVFGQGELPFYYVQVAPFFWDMDDPHRADYAFFREAQDHISKLNNTSMVVTMDVGESRDLHPKNKKPVGIRLALTALRNTYGDLSVQYQGPTVKCVEFNGGAAVVTYYAETVQSGLRTNDAAAPKHFFLAGDDQKFYPANAVIRGDRVMVTSSNVKSPVALRYAFTNYPVTNLENGDGLPAPPFRTDHWVEQTQEK